MTQRRVMHFNWKEVGGVIRSPFRHISTNHPSNTAISELFKVSLSDRNNKWKSQFYENVVSAKFVSATKNKFEKEGLILFDGPDRFKYLYLSSKVEDISSSTAQLYSFDSPGLTNIILENGAGVAINPDLTTGQVDYVFSHGSILEFHRNKSFLGLMANESVNNKLPLGPGIIDNGTLMKVGDPRDDYFLKTTREAIKVMLVERQLPKLKVALIEHDNIEEFAFLCKEDLSPEMFKYLSDSLTWFFPRNSYILIFSESKISHNEALMKHFKDL